MVGRVTLTEQWKNSPELALAWENWSWLSWKPMEAEFEDSNEWRSARLAFRKRVNGKND